MKFLTLIFFFLLINCKLNNSIESHGVSNLKSKINTIKVNITNQNDIVNLLGTTIVKDSFNKNIWSYYETKKETNFLGKKNTIINDVVILMFNDIGVLTEYETYDINNLKKLNFDDSVTEPKGIDQNILKSLLSSSKKRWDLARDKSSAN